MLKFIKIFFVLSIFISLGFFIAQTDIHLVKQSILGIGTHFYYLLLVTGMAYLLGTLAWKCCLGNEKDKINIFHLFWIRLIGETVSLFNPSSIVGGDLLKAAMLRPYEISKKTALSSVIVSRFLMIFSQLFMSLLAAILLMRQSKQGIFFQPNTQTIIKGASLFVLGLATLLFVYKRFKRSGYCALTKKLNWLNAIKTSFYEAYLSYQKDKWSMLLSFFLFSLHWLLGSMEFYFILRFLHIDVSVVDGLMIDMGVIFFKSAGAFIPGQLGIEEYGNQFMLYVIGISNTGIWLTASVLRRFRQLVWLGLGALSYIYYGRFLRFQIT